MKKIFLFLVAMLSATMMQAGLGLSVEGHLITCDTTITIHHIEYDDFTQDAEMSWEGTMFYNQGAVTVYIERTSVCLEEYEDQLCAGECKSGTAGQLRDTMVFNLSLYKQLPVRVYAHYYPQSKSVETIKYRFVGGGDDFTLTVDFDATTMGVNPMTEQKKSAKIVRDGQIIIVRDGKEYNALGTRL